MPRHSRARPRHMDVVPPGSPDCWTMERKEAVMLLYCDELFRFICIRVYSSYKKARRRVRAMLLRHVRMMPWRTLIESKGYMMQCSEMPAMAPASRCTEGDECFGRLSYSSSETVIFLFGSGPTQPHGCIISTFRRAMARHKHGTARSRFRETG